MDVRLDSYMVAGRGGTAPPLVHQSHRSSCRRRGPGVQAQRHDRTLHHLDLERVPTQGEIRQLDASEFILLLVGHGVVCTLHLLDLFSIKQKTELAEILSCQVKHADACAVEFRLQPCAGGLTHAGRIVRRVGGEQAFAILKLPLAAG